MRPQNEHQKHKSLREKRPKSAKETTAPRKTTAKQKAKTSQAKTGRTSRGASNELSEEDIEIGRLLGEGSQGGVYLTYRRGDDKPRLVTKRIRAKALSPYDMERHVILFAHLAPGSKSDGEVRSRLHHEEASLKAASEHDNCVRFHGLFPDSEGYMNLVMSRCLGGDLESYLKALRRHGDRETLSEDLIMGWTVQLSLALEHLHANRVIHRDVKPANIFLSRNREKVKLGDFGVSKKLDDGIDLAQTVAGSPNYMAPEILHGKPHGFAADVWGLGCVTYELATGGKKAFEASCLAALVVRVMRCDYEPLPARFSRPFASFLQSLMDPDPAERPSATRLLNYPFVRQHRESLQNGGPLTPPTVKPRSGKLVWKSYQHNPSKQFQDEKRRLAEKRHAAKELANRLSRLRTRALSCKEEFYGSPFVHMHMLEVTRMNGALAGEADPKRVEQMERREAEQVAQLKEAEQKRIWEAEKMYLRSLGLDDDNAKEEEAFRTRPLLERTLPEESMRGGGGCCFWVPIEGGNEEEEDDGEPSSDEEGNGIDIALENLARDLEEEDAVEEALGSMREELAELDAMQTSRASAPLGDNAQRELAWRMWHPSVSCESLCSDTDGRELGDEHGLGDVDEELSSD